MVWSLDHRLPRLRKNLDLLLGHLLTGAERSTGITITLLTTYTTTPEGESISTLWEMDGGCQLTFRRVRATGDAKAAGDV